MVRFIITLGTTGTMRTTPTTAMESLLDLPSFHLLIVGVVRIAGQSWIEWNEKADELVKEGSSVSYTSLELVGVSKNTVFVINYRVT